MKKYELTKIDTQIEKSVNIGQDNAEAYVKNVAELICSYWELTIEKDNLPNVILDRELPSNIQNFVAYCFLRVLNCNRCIFDFSKDFKFRIYSLFDRNLKLVYSALNIKEKDTTYEKELKLSGYILPKENNLTANLEFNQGIDVISKYENNFYRTIRNKENKNLLSNFVELDFNQQKFEHFFAVLKKYLDSDMNHKYELYNDTLNILNNLIKDFNSMATKYSANLFEQPFSKIRTAIEFNFLSDPASKPAKLEVVGTEKKYPFNIVGSKNKFELKIINRTLGSAFDSAIVIKDFSRIEIEILEQKQFVGTINTSTVNIEFNYEVLKHTSSLLIEGEIIWTNFDGKEDVENFYLELQGQTKELDWIQLEQLSPYDLEPVAKETELIGRDNILNQLRARIKNKLGSSYLYGQRRVGKTSVVKTLQSIEKSTDNLLIIYIEAGDWSDATGSLKSMNNLGKKICTKIKKHNRKFDAIKIPEFNGSLNQISDFLDDVIEFDDSFNALIILDEFDRISNELFKRNDVGQSFMLTLRAMSNRSQFGFILVGGEKLEYILSQWQEFNKFKPVRVDYFDKQNDWDDFKKLIKDPVQGLLEFNDKAIDFIYNQTSGNPYFTKLICIELFRYMVNNRDTHVTEKESFKATEIARNSSNIAATDFSHFWEDGIKEKVEKEEEVSINRRKLLITLSELVRKGKATTKENILMQAIEKGLSEETATRVLEEFEQRKIIKYDNNKFEFIVKFFEDWLVTQGIEKIITTFEEEERVRFQKRREEELRVTPKEILSLTDIWKTYRGKEVTSEKVLIWLNQFDGVYKQRLMYKILSNIKFYNENLIREKMEILFIEVQKQLKKKNIDRILDDKKFKRSDILVSYIDPSPSKSGAEYAKKFVEVNNIYFENAVEPSKIPEKLNDNIKALVFVDDLIGTGNTLLENIVGVLENLKSKTKDKEFVVICGYITGFQSASTAAEVKLLKKGLEVFVKIIDPLNNADKCFDESSKIFVNPNERNEAKNVCHEIGNKLEKSHPLGYGNCQTTIIFPTTCPNNSLPILWKASKDWTPLFER